MIPHGSAPWSLSQGSPALTMASPGAAPAKGKPREGGASGSLRRAFIGAALATSIPFLLLIAYLIWGQISREHSQVEREAFAQASLLSAQVEKHFGARIEALTGAASLLGVGGASPSAGEAQGRRLRQAFPDVDRAVLIDELGVAAASVPALAEGKRLAVGDQEWFKRAATSTDPFVGAPWRAGPEILVQCTVRTTEGQLRASSRSISCSSGSRISWLRRSSHREPRLRS